MSDSSDSHKVAARMVELPNYMVDFIDALYVNVSIYYQSILLQVYLLRSK